MMLEGKYCNSNTVSIVIVTHSEVTGKCGSWLHWEELVEMQCSKGDAPLERFSSINHLYS